MKVFGIGMPKTGTTSLNAALEILGIRSLHFPNDDTTVSELKAGKYKLSVLDKYDALTDVPIPAIFAQLDQAFPNSKFILTVREMDSWLESCRKADFNQPNRLPRPGGTREYYRALLYGTVKYNEDRFRWVHETHLKTVGEYFSGERAVRLLVMDFAAGDGWNKLCPFLGKDFPEEYFPHKNKRMEETRKLSES